VPLQRRHLIFGDRRLIWQCKSATWFEDVVPHALVDSYTKNITPVPYNWMNIQIPSLQALSGVVGLLNKKALAYPEDISRAFAGFQSHLQTFYEGGMLFGSPQFFFDIALFWRAGVDCRRRHRSDNFSGDIMQDNLPSWSWMGWEGDVKFPTDYEFADDSYSGYGSGFVAPVTEWYTLSSPNSIPGSLITSQWHHYRARSADEEAPPGWIRTRNNDNSKRWIRERPKDYSAFFSEHVTTQVSTVYSYIIGTRYLQSRLSF
jgi:hypothetical protein